MTEKCENNNSNKNEPVSCHDQLTSLIVFGRVSEQIKSVGDIRKIDIRAALPYLSQGSMVNPDLNENMCRNRSNCKAIDKWRLR